MTIYKVRIDKLTDEIGESHTVYGVDLYELTRSIPDITTSEERIRKLVDLFNDLDLAACHIDDVIEDELGR